jgi:hypothetical protein
LALKCIEVTGVPAGTPTAGGTFNFEIAASDGLNPNVAKNYTLTIAAEGAILPPASLLDTTVSPIGTGTATAADSYATGTNATVRTPHSKATGFSVSRIRDPPHQTENAHSHQACWKTADMASAQWALFPQSPENHH